jgi:Leucine-rich repeat (LRR) protein
MADTIYTVNRNIQSLDEIVDEIPEGTTILICNNKGCLSLRGIERLPFVTTLVIRDNQIRSLEGLVGSNVTTLNIRDNQIRSLEGLVGSNVTTLIINNNYISSLEGLAGSNVTKLHINHNQIRSLEGLAGSNVTYFYSSGNPCYEEFIDEFGRSVQKVKERYEFNDMKDPGFE